MPHRKWRETWQQLNCSAEPSGYRLVSLVAFEKATHLVDLDEGDGPPVEAELELLADDVLAELPRHRLGHHEVEDLRASAVAALQLEVASQQRHGHSLDPVGGKK